MKTLITSAACLLLLSGAASAAGTHSRSTTREHNLRFGLDTEIGIPLGNYSDSNSVGGGAFATADYGLLENLSATMRFGFQAHVNRTVGNLSTRVNAMPVLFGAKYFMAPERQGLFTTAEAGMFVLFSNVTRGALPSTGGADARFGMGLGLGYQQSNWNVRVNVHTQDVGNFGSAMMITSGIGYQFAGI